MVKKTSRENEARKYLAYILKKPNHLVEVRTVEPGGELVDLLMSEEAFEKWQASSFSSEEKHFLLPWEENSQKLAVDRVQLALTEQCNLKCGHCYVGLKSQKVLPFAFLKRLFDCFRQIGVRMISYTGGEPLLYKDFAKTIRLGRKLGFYQMLFTNGTLIDRKIAGELSQYLDKVRIGVDGPEPLHEKLRGVEGCFRRTSEGLRLLRQFKGQPALTIEVAMSILPFTRVYDFYRFYKMWEDQVDRLVISPVVPTGFAQGLTAGELKESYERFLDFLALLDRRSAKKVARREPALFQCDGGRDLIYISSRKEVYPCPLLLKKELKITTLSSDQNLRQQLGQALKNFKKWPEKVKQYARACRHCRSGCLYPCPAYRYHLGLLKNPWCLAESNFRIFNYRKYFDLLKRGKGERQEEVDKIVGLIKPLLKKGTKIVDLGCGDGTFLSLLSKKIQVSALVGVDKSKVLIRQAKEDYPDLHFENADCTQEEFPARMRRQYGQFNIALNIWTSILGYNGGKQDWAFLMNVYQLLRTGGVLLVDTNNLDFLRENFSDQSEIEIVQGGKVYQMVEKRKWRRADAILTFLDIYQDRHLEFSTAWEIKFYTPRELEKLLNSIGFVTLDCWADKRIIFLAQKASR